MSQYTLTPALAVTPTASNRAPRNGHTPARYIARFLGRIGFLSLLALISLMFLGCLRSGEERKPKRVIPGNALEASTKWPGTKLAFSDQEKNLLFKLRKHQGRSYKVFSPDRLPIGYARYSGELLQLTPHDPSNHGYVIAPEVERDALAEPNSEATKPPPTSFIITKQPPSKPKEPTATEGEPTVIAKLRKLQHSACHSWQFEDASGEVLATLTHHPKNDPK